MTKKCEPGCKVHSSISISKIRPWRHIRPLYRINKGMVSRSFPCPGIHQLFPLLFLSAKVPIAESKMFLQLFFLLPLIIYLVGSIVSPFKQSARKYLQAGRKTYSNVLNNPIPLPG